MQNSNVLLIEDIKAQAQNILDRLGHLGCTMKVAFTAADGLAAVNNDRPDLIILDIRLSPNDEEGEGFDVLRTLRDDPVTRTIPVIVYSIMAKDMENRLRSFGLGALWCLDKNQGIVELEAVVRRALEWTSMQNGASPTYERGLRYDPSSGTIWIDGKKFHTKLSRLQRRLLTVLHDRRGYIVSRQDIIRDVYEAEHQALNQVFDDDQIDALVARLRDKLGTSAEYIETIWGEGFKLRGEA